MSFPFIIGQKTTSNAWLQSSLLTETHVLIKTIIQQKRKRNPKFGESKQHIDKKMSHMWKLL